MPAAAAPKSTPPPHRAHPPPLPGFRLRCPPRSPGRLPRPREPVARPGLRLPDPMRVVLKPGEPHDVDLPDAATRPGWCRGAGAPRRRGCARPGEAGCMCRGCRCSATWGVGIQELQLGSALFHSMRAVRPSAEFWCARTLALEMAELQVKPVADFLWCFPCLEMLRVTYHMAVPQSMEIWMDLDRRMELWRIISW